jgi:hypothetical protein
MEDGETYGAMTPEQFGKLPGYAKTTMRNMVEAWERTRTALAEARRELAQGPENSRVYVNGLNAEPDRPLGASPVIIFDIEQAGMGPFVGTISAQFDTEGRRAVEIAAGGMADQLVLVPVAYNRFRVELVTRQGR